jgi:hypothetical protein
MAKSPLNGLIIRTAIVRRRGVGFIYACDPEKEKQDVPHAITFRLLDEKFSRGECNYNASSLCVIQSPVPGLVNIAENGYYSVNTASGIVSGDIFERSSPPSSVLRMNGFRSVSAIGARAYAVGYGTLVYRMDELTKWTRIDEGLPSGLNLQAAHGTKEDDFHVVGLRGACWHFNGARWTKIELPTNRNLTAVVHVPNGNVYIAGHGGLLIRGSSDAWRVIDQTATDDNIWDLEWFKDRLYASTLHNVFSLIGDELEAVDFGLNRPDTCYQLSASEGIMWSNGEHDIIAFDGVQWTRVV